LIVTEVRVIGFLAGLLLVVAAVGAAHAITAEVARSCEAAVAKAFPPRQIGNPAAGSGKGTTKERRDYFNKCVANNGKVDDGPGEVPGTGSK
jgi:hypothetical protein